MSAVLANPSRDGLVAAIEENLVGLFMRYAWIPGAEVIEGPGFAGVLTPVRDRSLNGIWRSSIEGPVDETIQALQSRFDARDTQLRWLVGPSSRPADLRSRLARRGFVHTSDWEGMAAPLERDPPRALQGPAGQVVEEALTPAGLDAWLRLYGEAVSLPPPVSQALGSVLREGGIGPGGRERLFSASLDGRAAGTIALGFDGGVAGIHYVATLPSARRRGVATGLVLHAMEEARTMGYQVAVLHSSAMGKGVYERAGFETWCTLESHVYPFIRQE